MSILFISDFHLGSPLFKNEFAIYDLVTKGNFEHIYVIGDVIDTWENDTSKIVNKYKNFLKLFDHTNVTIVKGNHDPDIATLKKIFPAAEIVMSKVIPDIGIVIHGDEFDKLVTKYSWVAKIFYPVHWLLQRFGINIKAFFREMYNSISAKRNSPYYPELVSDIEIKLKEKYLPYGYVFCGHTHEPKFFENYVNCGDWIHNKSYVIYDNGKIILRNLG
jgi:UDP-2,3-diacylglucosamine pyrophosphatase LpxH